MKRRKSRSTLQQSQSQQLRVQSPSLNSKLSNKSLHSSPRNKQLLLKKKAASRFSKNYSAKKETFNSLESLFELDKPICLDVEDFVDDRPVLSNLEKVEEKDYLESSTSDLQLSRPEDFIEKLQPVFLELKDSSRTDSANDEKSESASIERIDDIAVLSEIEEDDYASEMSTEEIFDLGNESTTQADGEDARSARTQKTTKSNAATSVAPSEDAQSSKTQKTTKSGAAEDAQSSKTQKTTKSGAVVSISPSSHLTEDAKSTRTQKDDARSRCTQKDDAQSRCAQKDNAQSRCTQKTGKSSCKGGDDDPSLYAPNYPLPCGVGEGVVVGCGKNCESVMSCMPLSEPCLFEEILRDGERAKRIRCEILDLKNSISDLACKAKLSEADTILLRDNQEELLCKIGELNEITRKIQRAIGMVDPSSLTFARMFDMLPYPHKPCGRNICGDDQPCDNDCEILDDCMTCEKFAFPQVEHREDKLPRVIICGSTEDNIPKIVVADSRPKSRGNKCLEDLTGRLSESLCLQEKLAKENACLEGGKFQLEKELLDKDNAVECLERKICDLQAEMRLIVKDNCELGRKVKCMEEQQQRSCSPTPRACPEPPRCPPKPCCPEPPRCPPKPCCPEPPRCPPKPCCPEPPRCPPRCPPKTCPEPPRCPPKPCPEPKCPSPKTNCSTPRKPEVVDLSCKCCSREQSAKPACPTASPKSCGQPAQGCCNSPRLTGGGSRGDMFNRQSGGGGCGKQNTCPPPRSNVCPAEIEEKLASYGNNTKHLGEQLCSIETEVRTLQTELMQVQREKQQLEQQRKLLECANPCSTCNPEPTKSCAKSVAPQDSMACLPCNDAPECAGQQLRDLREQYARLQDDYKSKLCEVSRLRSDSESLKRDAREAKEERERMEIKLIDAQERARCIESERNDLLGSKELLVEQEQALLVARQRYREAQDELEELRTMIRDQAAQIDDYRNKYLQAQQQVEEQRRQLDLMEMDNARMNENVTLEIGRVKNQFQEKLAELAPLPDILKQTQVKLQETQQLRMLAEHNCEDLSRELLTSKDRIDAMQSQINDLQREIEGLTDEKTNGDARVDELERKNSELRTECERLKNAVARFEEQQCAIQKKLDEKQHEIVQLNATLEQVREDSARQVARTKERCEAIKKSMLAQISEFEIQLAQCRAAAKTAQKERDEIRQKMQGQIVNLNEALQQAQGRIRSLQGHVDYLKVSYSNVFGGPGSGENTTPQMDPSSGQGYDSCDCNY